MLTVPKKEQVMAEVGNQQAADYAEGQMKGIEHARQDHPEQQHDCECSKFGFHGPLRNEWLFRNACDQLALNGKKM